MKLVRFRIIILLVFLLLYAPFSSLPIDGASQGGVIALTAGFGSDPMTTRAFAWQTVAGGVSSLQYEAGEANGAFNASHATEVKANQYVFKSDSGVRYVNKVSLNGLKPGTYYLYRVSDGNGGFSGVFHFKTEAAETGRFSFLTFSDTQSSSREQYSAYFANSLSSALKSFPDAAFILHTGDIVDNGSSEAGQWDFFFGAVRDILPNTAFEPVIGNHEGQFGGTANFLSHFNLPATHYSFVYGNCLFLVMDTNSGIQDQMDWLEKTAGANSSVKWKVVALHKGPYGGLHSNDPDCVSLRNELPGVFDKCGIDLALEGHDHAYMRSYFLSGGQVVKNPGVNGAYMNPSGTVYIVTGACGPKTYPVSLRYWTAKNWLPPQARANEPDEKLFDEIDVAADFLEVNVYTTDLRKVDYLKISKR